MSLEKKDWQKLKGSLIVLGVVVVICAVCIGLAYHYMQQQTGALEKQQNILKSAEQRYRASGAEKAMIIEFLPQYQALIDKGFIDEERRLEWIDLLRIQHQSLKLFGVSYVINQQEQYQPPFALNLGGFGLYRSSMVLDLDMLHEADILRLTEAMAAANATPFILQDCEMKRLNEGIMNKLEANMHAKCTLDWLTLREPKTAQVATP